jgi:peroxiredoxin
MLRPGDPLPELPLVTPEGRRVSLRALAGEATALIFLRHLG